MSLSEDLARIGPEPVGTRYEIKIAPRLDILNSPYSENALRNTVAGVLAVYRDWRLFNIAFVIENNMKVAKITVERVRATGYVNTAGPVPLAYVVTALAGALIAVLVIISVKEVGPELGKGIANGFILLAFAGVAYLVLVRKGLI